MMRELSWGIMRIGLATLLAFLFLPAGCSRKPLPVVEDLSRQSDTSRWTVQELSGKRDGDRLDAVLIVGDSSLNITAALRFQIGTPNTTLSQGAWLRDRGINIAPRPVTARSVTFLGGQNGPPSLGGTFDLLDGSGIAKYRVRLPVTQLKARE